MTVLLGLGMRALNREDVSQLLDGVAAPRRAVGQGRAQGRQQLGRLGADHLFGAHLQHPEESLFQGRHKGQRAAAEQDGRAHIAPPGQRSQGLQDHGVEDRGGNILFGHLAAEQVLQVGLGEHPAARSHGVDGGITAGQAIQLGHRHVQQRGHLVNERAGAAGARAVHADIWAVLLVEEDDLGIFAADIYQRAHLGITLVHHLGRSHHFLDERQAVFFGHPQPGRAGHQ